MSIERWRTCLSLAILATVVIPTIGCAGSPAKRPTPRQPDMRLLQFLGSADPTAGEQHSDGGSWMLYLSELKLGKAAKSTGGHASTPAHKPVTEPHASGVGSR